MADFMTINRIAIGRMELMSSFYFNFNINLLANYYLVISKFSNVIATKTNITYLLVFGQSLNIPFEKFGD